MPIVRIVPASGPVGVVSHNDLAKALGQQSVDTPISEIMRRDFISVSPREMLESAFARLQDGDSHVVPVVDNGRLIGVLTTDNITEVLMIEEAMRARHRGAPRTADTRRGSEFKLAGAR